LVTALLKVKRPGLDLVTVPNHIPSSGLVNSLSSSLSVMICQSSDLSNDCLTATSALSSAWYVTSVIMLAAFGSTVWNSCGLVIPSVAGMLWSRVRMVIDLPFLNAMLVFRLLRPPMLRRA
jgi:p-aminobenzoyl-glutamate transporter AbgT